MVNAAARCRPVRYNMKSYFYRVAGIVFRADLPESIDAERCLPSFRAFCCGRTEPDFVFVVSVSDGISFPQTEVVDESDSDLGNIILRREV